MNVRSARFNAWRQICGCGHDGIAVFTNLVKLVNIWLAYLLDSFKMADLVFIPILL